MHGFIKIYCQSYPVSQQKPSEEKKLQHTLGMDLLRLGLQKEYRIEFTEDMIAFGENGKPLLCQDEVFFNISHCRGLAVCAISDVPVGVDVECRQSFRENVLRKACSEGEISFIRRQDTAQRFLRVWTLKESYLKMTGEGLKKSLLDVQFELDETELHAHTKADTWIGPSSIRCSQKGCFYQKIFGEGIALSVCTKEKVGQPELIILPAKTCKTGYPY